MRRTSAERKTYSCNSRELGNAFHDFRWIFFWILAAAHNTVRHSPCHSRHIYSYIYIYIYPGLSSPPRDSWDPRCPGAPWLKTPQNPSSSPSCDSRHPPNDSATRAWAAVGPMPTSTAAAAKCIQLSTAMRNIRVAEGIVREHVYGKKIIAFYPSDRTIPSEHTWEMLRKFQSTCKQYFGSGSIAHRASSTLLAPTAQNDGDDDAHPCSSCLSKAAWKDMTAIGP